MLADNPAGPPPMMATSSLSSPCCPCVPASAIHVSLRVYACRRQEGFRSVSGVLEASRRNEVHRAQRRTVGLADDRRRGFTVHHAGGIAGVVEAEGVPDFMTDDATNDDRRERPAGAVAH